MLAGAPVTERMAEVDGVSTSLLEAGSGPSLLLMHGGIECGGAYWSPVIPSLADRFRIIVPDMPGLGESAPFAELDPERFANWFSELIRVTSGDRPVVVAHSLSGSLAARFAVHHSNELNRLVIYAGPGIGPPRRKR